MRRAATIAALTVTMSSCMLLIDDPPERISDGAGGKASGPGFSCQEQDYSCTCVVDDSSQQDACYMVKPHSYEVCCATDDWPNSGSCSCVAAGCETDFDDVCSCSKGSHAMEGSCSDAVSYCGSSDYCEPCQGDECFCNDGTTAPVASCEIAALGCEAGEKLVTDCD